MTDEQIIRAAAWKFYPPRGSDREDLIQVGRIALWKTAGRAPSDPEHAINWKRTIVHVAIIDYLREQTWEPRSTLKDDSRPTMINVEKLPEGVESTTPLSSLVLRDVERKINKMSPTSRRVFESRIQGFTNVEIAGQLDLSDARISQILNEIRDAVAAVIP